MRWLLIVLLVSVLALLVAAAGVARHIVLQRSQQRARQNGPQGEPVEPADESDG
jgi:hypothetical protein